jgi:hypothetical protein
MDAGVEHQQRHGAVLHRVLWVQVGPLRRCSSSWFHFEFWRIDVAAWHKFPRWGSQFLVVQWVGNLEERSGKLVNESS